MKYQAMFFNDKRSLIDCEYYQDEPSDKDILELAIKLNSSIIQVYYDKYETEEYSQLICEYN